MHTKPSPFAAVRQGVGVVLAAALFFLAVCLNSTATIKQLAFFLILLSLSAAFLFYERLRDRLKPPVVALALVVLADGLSNLYAVAGKLALYEFLKVLTSFCLVLIVLAFAGERTPERGVSSMLAGCAALAGLVSIDLLSTRFISTPVLALLGRFTRDYMELEVVEEGVRMLSIFPNPNTFAGCIGIGVLLSLGLADSEERRGVRAVHLICLAVNSLAFVLAFSMGACAMIVPAFLVLLLLEKKERRIDLLLLMVETLLVTALAAFPISLTSMTAWTGVRPVPLLCTVAGAGALCALDFLVGRRIADRLRRHGKMMFGLAGGLLAALALFLLAAFHFTTGVTLQPGDSLRRSAYLDAGAYTLTAESDGEAQVEIESQNRADTMMHTSTVLYSGPLSQAAFAVPEDSLVVWFSLSADAQVRLDAVRYGGEGGSGTLPLGYRLLPGFIANRLQGLWVNQNAIQRLVFFEDGLKLFRRSPVTGLGMGAFENGSKGVQSFYYGTKYVHNQYIQALVDTGIVGLVLFLGLLTVSAAAVWRSREKALSPALGAALMFMAGHGGVEVVFCAYPYLPMAFGVFAAISLCGGSAVPVPRWADKAALRGCVLLVACGLLSMFGGLLYCNIAAQNVNHIEADPEILERAIRLDRFEWADYMLAYVVRASGPETDEATRQTADEYAVRLSELKSNTVPFYLAEYYLKTGRMERGLELAEQYVNYVAANPVVWNRTFALLEQYEQDTDVYRAGVAHIAALRETWNRENMGYIDLSEDSAAFIARVCG